jgi:hypothetical protein
LDVVGKILRREHFDTMVGLPAMECEEKARLVEEHHRAALAYSMAARVLNASRARDAEHEKWRAAADKARTKSKEAREALERHQAEHGY